MKARMHTSSVFVKERQLSVCELSLKLGNAELLC